MGESSGIDGLNLMVEIAEIRKLGHEVAIQDSASGNEIPIEDRSTGSWAQNEHTSYHALKLTYMEPMIKNGIKIAQVDINEVQEQAACWNLAIICMIARMAKGLTMARFNDEATKDQVLENGVIQFDRKPVIVRPWTTDMNTVKLVKSIPL
ncbi:hypothetical protein G4B88_000345 [Cannabis sativa]|uniref:DUF4283 domain-containing protein n=1 Tax=Cannabis sativa TaxID=3483 RepID=A0A7J6F3J9_CANSA|nr:hypothetical protein G4B88_000345 [Cannabis sativa]